ncbi:MAG: 5-(carboxyamino)imidazole ribonucleotide synthase [Coxiellaceae bacterium]|nr:5-(carboxyamino)imidazole ribonucleotide synthase [Coxiellaceae bacterium]
MKIGIIGSGQLARMMILAGIPMGLSFVTYGPDAVTSMGEYAPHCKGEYDDADALKRFASSVDVLTYEHENLPVEVLRQVESQYALYPGSEVIGQVQDRLFEKQMFEKLGVPTNAFIEINSIDDAKKAGEELGFPFIIKARRFGYDGKHQYRINHTHDLEAITNEQCQNCIAEAFVAFDREISIIVVRSQQGECQFYDVCENQHEAGILRQTENQINDPLFEAACNEIEKIVDSVNYVGVMALELFVKDDQLLANEVAPRVHNSGHWTIEGADTSQFENHVRAICNLPLGSTQSITEVQMTNCIGEMPNIHGVLKNPMAYYHDYGKSPRPGRKLGHITVIKD